MAKYRDSIYTIEELTNLLNKSVTCIIGGTIIEDAYFIKDTKENFFILHNIADKTGSSPAMMNIKPFTKSWRVDTHVKELKLKGSILTIKSKITLLTKNKFIKINQDE